MKKVFAGVVLPVVAAAAIIGSGFSVWFFGENEVKTSADASVEVTNLLRIGTLTMEDKGTLVLDQTAAVRKYIANNGKADKKEYNKDAAANLDDKKTNATGFEALGVHFEAQKDSKFNGRITYTSPKGEGESAGKYMDEIANVAKLKIVTTITFENGESGSLSKYLTITKGKDSDIETIENKDNVYTITWKQGVKSINLPFGNIADASLKFGYAAYNKTTHYTGLYTTSDRDTDLDKAGDTGKVLETAEPHNTKEYDQLVKDVKGTSVKIDTVATIVEDTNA